MKSICYFGPSYLSGWILLLWASLCVRQYPTDAFLFQTNLVETTTIGKAVKVAVRTQTDEYWLPPTKQLRVIRSVLNGRGGIYNHECDDNNDDGDGDNGCHLVNDCQFAIGRRDVIQNSLLSAASMSTIGSTIVAPAHASPSMATVAVPTVAVATDLGRQIDINCLTDLPPVADDDVRLYFCRHGQTENNRLRKVQGARVLDQPINDNGRIQSESLGTALARALLPQSGSESSMGTFTKKNVRPTVLFVSSPLQRAKMTASIAATQLVASGNSRRIRRRPTSPTATTVAIPPLDTLAEVDFGPLADGQPILLVQEKIAIAYATWASGRVDYRHEGGGDSGREVLTRCCTALQELVEAANAANARSVVAVSHSAFLRALIGVLLNEPILTSAARKIWNGSITVVDIPKVWTSRTDNTESRLFEILGGVGTLLSEQPLDLTLSIPESKVIRINEFRHLPPSTLVQ